MIVENQVKSLQELLEVLPSCGPADYVAITKGMQLQLSDFQKYMTFRADRYTRNCIVRTEKYELILLCWEADQYTSIHCHGGEECWVYNLQGKIQEEHYDYVNGSTPVLRDTHVLHEGEISYMNDDIGHHKLINANKGRSFSLHLYMNPIDHCTSWNNEINAFVPVSLKYDTLEGRPC